MRTKIRNQENGEDHLTRIFYLDGPNFVGPNKLMKLISQFLKEQVSKAEHCANCGGIVPEMGFRYEGVDYIFACIAIEKDGKMIGETDYERFGKYCQSLKTF